jgi:hypothetical protein
VVDVVVDEGGDVVVDVLQVPPTTLITMNKKEKERGIIRRQQITAPRRRQRSCPNRHSSPHPLVADEAGDFTVVEEGVVVVGEK